MWELDCEEIWAPKNWCFWTVVLGKTLERTLDCKEIQPVNLNRDQSWVFTGRTDVEAETPILWPSDAKSWLIVKFLDAEKDWRWEEKGMTEDEMVGWHHWLNGLVLEQLRELVKDREAWCAVVHGVTKSQTRLSLWTELNTMSFQGFPHNSVGKKSACNAGDLGSIPGSRRSPGEGNGNPLQYSCLENPMDRGTWRATVHGVTRVGHDLATKHQLMHVVGVENY